MLVAIHWYRWPASPIVSTAHIRLLPQPVLYRSHTAGAFAAFPRGCCCYPTLISRALPPLPAPLLVRPAQPTHTPTARRRSPLAPRPRSRAARSNARALPFPLPLTSPICLGRVVAVRSHRSLLALVVGRSSASSHSMSVGG